VRASGSSSGTEPRAKHPEAVPIAELRSADRESSGAVRTAGEPASGPVALPEAGGRAASADRTAAERVVCCEIKAKSEQTEAKPKSLWRTLDHARRLQLPKGKPGMIMIKLPEVWVKQQETQSVIAAAVQKVCRQSHRLVAVIYTWEEWHSTRKGWRVVLTKFYVHRNNRSELYAPDIEALLEGIGRVRNAQWLSFRAFVEQLSRQL
jgi:hypothetical protein